MTKRKVFISYYHKEDQFYKNEFERLFGDIFINKSVQDGDINSDTSSEYIKRLIQEDYISDTSVLVVLIGSKTHCRKHVDWEISAALNLKVGGHSGLVGILLPTNPSFDLPLIFPNDIPPRLLDNVSSGYSNIYKWCTSKEHMELIIEQAFNNKNEKSNLIKNSREQYINNKCS